MTFNSNDASPVPPRTAGSATRSKQKTAKNWTMASIAWHGRRHWPERLALADECVRLTFSELHGCARRLADRLSSLGVGPGDRVAVAGDRNVDTVVAILGVCMLGACYVPLDPTQPSARLRFLLDDADVCGLIGTESSSNLVGTPSSGRFFLELEGLACRGDEPLHEPARDLPYVHPDSVAYIMYTSGSTGLPKGVQIEHRSIQTFFETHNERVRFRPGDRSLNSGPMHFDVSLMDVFLPLYAGASVFFGSKLHIPSLVLRSIADQRITHFYAVGTVLSLITGDGKKLDQHDLSSLCILQTGAEVCNVRVVNEWLARYPKLRFLNSYGPTEATVGCISYLKPTAGPMAEESCPIGLPHRGTTIALLAQDGRPVTTHATLGELAIAGPQLMRGYWRRDAENDKAFVWLGGVRFYRTGDQAYRDEAGNYHFAGRRDDEIKLNGHRIHLNEVLRSVHADPRVESAVAGVINNESGALELVVLAVTTAPASSELALDLELLLSAALPRAMQPARWGFLRAFPRLPSGKVDRQACLDRLTRAVKRTDARHYAECEESFNPL